MLIFVFLLTALMFTVIITDLTRYIIPNWLVGLVLVMYPVMLMVTPERPNWQIALVIGLATFAVGFGMFAIKIMGAGDVKLLIALSLWTGKSVSAEFFLGVGILGGLLAFLLLVLRPFTAFMFAKLEKPPTIPRVLTAGEPVPYGIAIAIAFLMLLWTRSIPGITF